MKATSMDDRDLTTVEVAGKTVKVIAPEAVRSFVREHGGKLYLWTTVHGVCEGKITLLEARTERPSGATLVFEPLAGPGFKLLIALAGRRPPEQIVLELGRRGRKLKAYWNNWAYVN